MAIDHYLFIDSNGAEYKLYPDPANAGNYVSKESIYITYVSSTNRIYFNDGSFWIMGCYVFSPPAIEHWQTRAVFGDFL